jgi:hypothetical protein
MLVAFAAGLDFEGAVEQATQAQADFDAGGCLQHHLARGTITGFALTY